MSFHNDGHDPEHLYHCCQQQLFICHNCFVNSCYNRFIANDPRFGLFVRLLFIYLLGHWDRSSVSCFAAERNAPSEERHQPERVILENFIGDRSSLYVRARWCMATVTSLCCSGWWWEDIELRREG